MQSAGIGAANGSSGALVRIRSGAAPHRTVPSGDGGFGAASRFGLHEMAGNVTEWTASHVRSYAGPDVVPPSQAPDMSRGGNHQNGPYSARSSFREWAHGPDFAWTAGGLRPARPVAGL